MLWVWFTSIKMKPKVFIRNLSQSLFEEFEQEIEEDQLEKSFKEAIKNLPDGKLKDDLDTKFSNYLQKLQKRLQTLGKRELPSINKGVDDSLEELASELDDRKEVADEPPKPTHSMLYNLMEKAEIKKPKKKEMKKLSNEQRCQTYRMFLKEVLGRPYTAESVLTEVIQDFQDTCHIDQETAEGKKQPDWLPVCNVLLELTTNSPPVAYIRVLKTLYQSVENDVNKCLSKKKVVSAGKLIAILKRFIISCHLDIKKCDLDPSLARSFSRYTSALLSYYVDLCALYSRKIETKKKYGRDIAGFVSYILQPWPESMIEVALCLSGLSEDNYTVMFPLLSKCSELKPCGASNSHYLKYVLMVKHIAEAYSDYDDIEQIINGTKIIAAPKSFIDWLKDECPEALEFIPWEDKKFKKQKITTFLLEEADDDLISILLDSFCSDKDGELHQTNDEKTQDVNGDMASEALFYLDTAGWADATEITEMAEAETSTDAKKSKHTPIILKTMEEVEQLVNEYNTEGSRSPQTYRLGPEFLSKRVKDPEDRKFLQSEIVSITSVSSLSEVGDKSMKINELLGDEEEEEYGEENDEEEQGDDDNEEEEKEENDKEEQVDDDNDDEEEEEYDEEEQVDDDNDKEGEEEQGDDYNDNEEGIATLDLNVHETIDVDKEDEHDQCSQSLNGDLSKNPSKTISKNKQFSTSTPNDILHDKRKRANKNEVKLALHKELSETEESALSGQDDTGDFGESVDSFSLSEDDHKMKSIVNKIGPKDTKTSILSGSIAENQPELMEKKCSPQKKISSKSEDITDSETDVNSITVIEKKHEVKMSEMHAESESDEDMFGKTPEKKSNEKTGKISSIEQKFIVKAIKGKKTPKKVKEQTREEREGSESVFTDETEGTTGHENEVIPNTRSQSTEEIMGIVKVVNQKINQHAKTRKSTSIDQQNESMFTDESVESAETQSVTESKGSPKKKTINGSALKQTDSNINVEDSGVDRMSSFIGMQRKTPRKNKSEGTETEEQTADTQGSSNKKRLLDLSEHKTDEHKHMKDSREKKTPKKLLESLDKETDKNKSGSVSKELRRTPRKYESLPLEIEDDQTEKLFDDETPEKNKSKKEDTKRKSSGNEHKSKENDDANINEGRQRKHSKDELKRTPKKLISDEIQNEETPEKNKSKKEDKKRKSSENEHKINENDKAHMDEGRQRKHSKDELKRTPKKLISDEIQNEEAEAPDDKSKKHETKRKSSGNEHNAEENVEENIDGGGQRKHSKDELKRTPKKLISDEIQNLDTGTSGRSPKKETKNDEHIKSDGKWKSSTGDMKKTPKKSGSELSEINKLTPDQDKNRKNRNTNEKTDTLSDTFTKSPEESHNVSEVSDTMDNFPVIKSDQIMLGKLTKHPITEVISLDTDSESGSEIEVKVGKRHAAKILSETESSLPTKNSKDMEDILSFLITIAQTDDGDVFKSTTSVKSSTYNTSPVKSPASEKSLKSPALENSAAAPASKRDLKSPASEKFLKSPASESSAASPASKNDLKSPASENSLKSPASENSSASPASKKSLKSPASEKSLKSPASEKSPLKSPNKSTVKSLILVKSPVTTEKSISELKSSSTRRAEKGKETTPKKEHQSPRVKTRTPNSRRKAEKNDESDSDIEIIPSSLKKTYKKADDETGDESVSELPDLAAYLKPDDSKYREGKRKSAKGKPEIEESPQKASEGDNQVKNETTPTRKSKRKSIAPGADKLDTEIEGPSRTKRTRSATKSQQSDKEVAGPSNPKAMRGRASLAKTLETDSDTSAAEFDKKITVGRTRKASESENENKSNESDFETTNARPSRKSVGGRRLATVKEVIAESTQDESDGIPATPPNKSTRERKGSASTSKKVVKKVEQLRGTRKRRLSGEMADSKSIETCSTDSEVPFPNPKKKTEAPLKKEEPVKKNSKRLSAPVKVTEPNKKSPGKSAGRRYSLRNK